MLVRVSILLLVLAVVLASYSSVLAADEPATTKLRVCVADFRPEAGTVLNEKELVYCKMLQRGVEDELVQWFEVEESTRYGTIAKELANLDSAQAATTLGEKAGVHQVVTGLVTKVGATVMVQCHFVQVPRAGQAAQEATNKVIRTANADFKITQEDDWVELVRVLQAKIALSVTGKATVPVAPKTKIRICKVSGMTAGPNCNECGTKEVSPDTVPEVCTVCKGTAPCPTEDQIKLRIAQALRALDDGKYNDSARTIDDVVKTDAANGEAWYIRGVTRFFQKKYTEAEQSYLKAIELGYDRASVRDDLANVYWNLAARPKKGSHDLDKAIEQAYKSLSLAPGNPWAYNTIGCVTFQMAITDGKNRAKLKVAADSLKKAAELLTSDPQLLDNLANALAQLDELSEAERYAKASLAAAERNKEPYPKAYDTLANIYAVKGDKNSAERYHELYRKAVGK